jgi:hypothetical protein
MAASFIYGITFDTVHKLLSLVISLVTLTILIVGYYKYLQNQLRSKQLDTVYELIKQIQQYDWQYLHFNMFDDAPLKKHIATLFDIGEMSEFDECEKLYFWGKDIEKTDEDLLSWDFFFNFHSHPYLPISIAIPLKKFNLWQQQNQVSCKEANNTKCIIIGRKKVIPEEAYYIYFSEGNMKTCKEFKQSALELRKAIIKWSSKYGLKD